MELNDFLSDYRIDEAVWDRANIPWGDLLAIKKDYENRRPHLEEAAQYAVKVIQGFDGVHSVRWRVKDSLHLLEKIVRKRASSKPAKKYLNISVDNYLSAVTDLIGVRALHLFKTDILAIHPQIKSMWLLGEKPISYVRAGDKSAVITALESAGVKSKIHDAGYRSVHYILKMRPGISEMLIELQVRTIFEEAWSEIDHKVRYPNFSDNKQIEDVLTIFNRLSGGADELGGFIKELSLEFNDLGRKIENASRDRDEAIEEIQRMVSLLSSSEQDRSETSKQMALIQKELDKVKSSIKVSKERKWMDFTTFDIENPGGVFVSPGDFLGESWWKVNPNGKKS